MKQPFVLLIAFGLAGLTGSYAETQKNLTVQALDGTEKNVSVTEIKKLTFINDQLVINYSDGTSNSQALSTINKLYFSTLTGLKQTGSACELMVYPNPVADILTIKQASESMNRLTLYRLDGTFVYRKQFSSGETQLDVSSLANGLYILSINQQVFKIRVQK